MGSLCWKAISMDKLALLIILTSLGQDNLLSATTSHEKVESLVDHLDMKFSQMMKDQQEEIKQLTEQLEEQTNHVSSLTELVDSLSNNVLRSPPAVFYCGYTHVTTAIKDVITFDRLSYSYNNQKIGGLDPKTGIFTSPSTGIYSVTWSLMADSSAGEHVHINLHKNGTPIGEYSKHYSDYTGVSG